MIIKSRKPGWNLFLFFNFLSLAQAQSQAQTQAQDQAKDLAQSQGQDQAKLLAKFLAQAHVHAQDQAQAHGLAQAQSQSQGQTQAKVLAPFLVHAQAAQAQAQEQFNTQTAEAFKQTVPVKDRVYTVDVISHQPNIGSGGRKTNHSGVSGVSGVSDFGIKKTFEPQRSHIGNEARFENRPQTGTESGGGTQDGSESGGGNQDVSESYSGYQDGSESGGGNQDGSESYVGYQDGSESGGGYQDGSESYSGYQDDSESGGGYRDVTESYVGYQDGTESEVVYQVDSEAEYDQDLDSNYYPTKSVQDEQEDFLILEEQDGDVDDSESVDVCSTIRGETCLFPYVHNGYTHYECTTMSPVGNTTFGRCPTRYSNESAKLPSLKAEDWGRCSTRCPLQAYTSNQKINQILKDTVASNPDLVQLLDVGVSVNDQPILGVAISSRVRNRAQLRPMVKYIGNIHGNEPVGRELLVHLIRVLVQGYNNGDQRITNLLETTNITIIPTMNPDGFDRSKEGECSGGDFKTGRYNEGNKDLNRDFPTWRDVKNSLEENMEGRQPETQALMKLITAEPWVLSANFHGGAVVASYPYDDYYSGTVQRGIHKTEDHAFFKHLASTYADSHLTMKDKTKCTKWIFEDGITNGADWYALVGGMQDFNYLYSNGMEITLEVSCCKYPAKYYLNQRWDENRESLFAYIEQVHRGFKGLVRRNLREKGNINISNAIIEVENLGTGMKTRHVRSSNLGEYWKLLLPGQYSIRGIEDRCESSGFMFTSDYIKMNVTELQPLVQVDIDLIHRDNCSENIFKGREE